MKLRPRSFSRDESGTVLIMAGILLVVFLGFGALAIDIGRIAVVRNELQNAADAGAMAGARGLVPFINLAAPVPYWSNGQAVALQTVRLNKADGAFLTNCQIEVGYWNFLTKQMQSTAIAPTNLDAPAVRVTVRKTAGQNGGPVPLFLARIWGRNLADTSATASSAISGPGAIGKGGLFPIAVAEQVVIDHWDDNPYYRFKIGSDYHYPDEQAGQWTSFLVDENNVPFHQRTYEPRQPRQGLHRGRHLDPAGHQGYALGQMRRIRRPDGCPARGEDRLRHPPLDPGAGLCTLLC